METIACHFVFYTGPRKGDAEAFQTARITIGRAGSCDYRLDTEPVASQHAEILLEDGVYRLYDLGSKAGTYVNGERVHERCTLESEDYLRFGQEGPEVIFRTGVPKPGKQPLPQIFPVTAELEFFSGSDAGRIFPINAAVVTNIGRRAELEIPLDPRGDMIVSGNHCNIRYLDGHFVMSDTSRNGTYVNGDLVEQPMEILDGDVIMLGDGGPQARFRVDPAKRHYPNHRILSPVAKPEPEAKSAMPPKPAPTPGPLLASAAPYASGSPRPDLPTPAGEAPSEENGVLSAGAATGSIGAAGLAGEMPDNVDGEAEPTEPSVTGATPGPSASEPDSDRDAADSVERPSVPSPTSRPAAVPLTHKLGFKPGKKVIIAAVAVVALIAIIALLPSGDNEKTTGSAPRSNYAASLAKLKAVENPAGYTVQVPEGWTSLSEDNKVSAESADKKISLDYVRDPRLNEAKVRQMLGSNGATVNPDAQDKTKDGVKVKMMDASIGSIRRLAVLHQPASGAPALAMMETNESTLEALDEETINRLLVDNVEVVAAPAEATASPDAKQTPEAALPTPGAATPTPADTAAKPAATAAPTPATTPETTPPATAAASPTPAEASPSTAAENTKPIKSEALKLTVNIPSEWTGESEEADAMITLSDGKGLEVRIARDPGDLDPKGTFDAMVTEGWTKDGTKTDAAFQAAEFAKDGQNLMLGLIPEKAKTTLVVYATSNKDFTADQRRQISLIIYQLATAQQ